VETQKYGDTIVQIFYLNDFNVLIAS
jgi:hypothetical protein